MKKKAKKHGGRRKNAGRKPSDNPKTLNLSAVRITPGEKEQVTAAAQAAGRSFSAHVRACLGLS